jgi:hypothetical protein
MSMRSVCSALAIVGSFVAACGGGGDHPSSTGSGGANNSGSMSGGSAGAPANGGGGGNAVGGGGSNATGGGGALATKNCFPSPHACGFPDPKAGTVGVPTGTHLTKSKDVTVMTDGKTIQNLDIDGGIDVEANNVTIANVKVTVPGPGCPPSTPCGTNGIHIGPDVHGTRIKNVEVTAAAGARVQYAVLNRGTDTQAVGLYAHDLDSMWTGSGIVKDSYSTIILGIQNDHLEDLYVSDDVLTVDHSVLFNPQGQTATVFVDTGGGEGDSNLTVTNSLLAGGGYVLYPAGNSTSVGTGKMTISGNRIARCLGAPMSAPNGGMACSGGKDEHGFWPNGGYYGVGAYLYCPPVAGQVWSNNVWDDDSSAINCPG